MTEENTVNNDSNNVNTNGEVENSHHQPSSPLSTKNFKCHFHIHIYIYY